MLITMQDHADENKTCVRELLIVFNLFFSC